MTGLFQAAAEATEEAILNALTAAETMVGQRPGGVRASSRSPHERDAALPPGLSPPGAGRSTA